MKVPNITFRINQSVRTELSHAYGWTDIMKLIVTVTNFGNIPKIIIFFFSFFCFK